MNDHDAKDRVSRPEKPATGQDIVIANTGKQEVAAASRLFGAWKGKIRIGEDFDAPLPPHIARGFGTE